MALSEGPKRVGQVQAPEFAMQVRGREGPSRGHKWALGENPSAQWFLPLKAQVFVSEGV